MDSTYGMTDADILLAHAIVMKTREFPKNHYVDINGQKVTLDKLSKDLIVNPKNFLTDIQHRIESFQEYAKKRDLCEIVIILTTQNHDKPLSEILDYFTLQIKQITQLKAWKDIQKNLRCYFQMKEPHASGVPHMNIVFWLPHEAVEPFLKALQKKYKPPQIHIISSYIPESYTHADRAYKKEGKWQYGFQKNGVDGFIVQSDQSMVPYVTKNFKIIAKEIEDDNFTSYLSTWYLVNRIKLFSTSQTFASIDAYRKVSKFFSLNQFSDLVHEGIIQIFRRDNNRLYLITKGSEVLWIKKHTTLQRNNAHNKKSKIDSQHIDLKKNIQKDYMKQGTLTTNIKSNGILLFEISLIQKPEETSIVENILQSNHDDIAELKQEIIQCMNEAHKINANIKKLTISDTKKEQPMLFCGVKDIEDLFSISSESQKNYRNRVKDPLPYYQEGANSKIKYKIIEVEEWMEKYKIK